MTDADMHRLTTINPETRTGECAICGPVQLKRRNPRTPNGAVRWSCKASEKSAYRYRPSTAQRRAYRLRSYGMSVAEYESLLAKQGGVCAICGSAPRLGTHLHIDHDHACCSARKRSCGGCVRGLLCPTCNTLLHRFDTLPDFVDRVMNYLDR